MTDHPGHPEAVDPPWFRELVRRAFDRELRRLYAEGAAADDAWEMALWYVIDLRSDLTELYKAGGVG